MEFDYYYCRKLLLCVSSRQKFLISRSFFKLFPFVFIFSFSSSIFFFPFSPFFFLFYCTTDRLQIDKQTKLSKNNKTKTKKPNKNSVSSPVNGVRVR
jgi:hypothetical protein